MGEPSDRNRSRRGCGRVSATTRWFLVIFALAAAVRLTVLISSQQNLRSDEAAVAIMANHIFTHHEYPLFLWAQDYGGGHALVAYLAAPLFALFGMSGRILGAVSLCFGLANILLLFLLLRRYVSDWVTLVATAFFALSPPVLAGNRLINGGTEAVFFGLLAVNFFTSDLYASRFLWWRVALIGLACGVACWCMDYTVMYPVTFVVIWLVWRREAILRRLGMLVAGSLIGMWPVIYQDVTHNFAHLNAMLRSGSAEGGFLARAGESFSSIWMGDLAAFLTTNLDDYTHAIPPDAWLHYALFLLALGLLAHSAIRAQETAAETTWPPFAVLPLVYVAVFCVFYSLAGWSSPILRVPRYFLPLYPLFAVVIAMGLSTLNRFRIAQGLSSGRIAKAPVEHPATSQAGENRPEDDESLAEQPGRFTEKCLRTICTRAEGHSNPSLVTGFAMVFCTLCIWRSTDLMFRDTHREHQITTSGQAVRDVVAFLDERHIRYVMTPYEIQWRLMFESHERIVASSVGIGAVTRYPPYDEELYNAAVIGDAPYAFVFRRDFAFADITPWPKQRKGVMAVLTPELRNGTLSRRGIRYEVAEVAGEFVVFHNFSENVFRAVAQAAP
jgi:hypothetical protein